MQEHGNVMRLASVGVYNIVPIGVLALRFLAAAAAQILHYQQGKLFHPMRYSSTITDRKISIMIIGNIRGSGSTIIFSRPIGDG